MQLTCRRPELWTNPVEVVAACNSLSCKDKNWWKWIDGNELMDMNWRNWIDGNKLMEINWRKWIDHSIVFKLDVVLLNNYFDVSATCFFWHKYSKVIITYQIYIGIKTQSKLQNQFDRSKKVKIDRNWLYTHFFLVGVFCVLVFLWFMLCEKSEYIYDSR